MVEKSQTSISLKEVKIEKQADQHRCEYCHKVFIHPPLVVFLKPTTKYKPSGKYPAFQLCSEICLNRLEQEGWMPFKLEERK